MTMPVGEGLCLQQLYTPHDSGMLQVCAAQRGGTGWQKSRLHPSHLLMAIHSLRLPLLPSIYILITLGAGLMVLSRLAIDHRHWPILLPVSPKAAL